VNGIKPTSTSRRIDMLLSSHHVGHSQPFPMNTILLVYNVPR
jgi:hypothetical protein